MTIEYSPEFKKELKNIQIYISKDNTTASKKFIKDLKKQIEDILNMPYKYRPSYYHDDESVRDMIYKGYTIIYKIYDEYIKIVEIFNQNLPILKEQNL